MDWSQYLYAFLLALAIYTGGPARIVVFAMILDLAGTLWFNSSPVAVAVVDLAAVCFLIGHGARANSIAALFLLMQPVYVLGLKSAQIYALVDLIAYLQLFILGHGDVGLVRLRRAIVGYLRGYNRAMVHGGSASFHLAADHSVVAGERVSDGKG